MRVAEDHHFTAFGLTLQILKIEGEAAVHGLHWTTHEHPACAVRNVDERRIDRRGDQHFVAWTREGLQHEGNALYDTRYEAHPVPFCGDAVSFLEPVQHGHLVAVRCECVA